MRRRIDIATGDFSRVVRAGFTGTQVGATRAQLARLADGLAWLARTLGQYDDGAGEIEFGHGVCIGADDNAATLASSLDCVRSIREFPPTNTSKMASVQYHPDVPVFREAPAAYLARNQAIVRWCVCLFATPEQQEGEVLRSGTWSTVRFARRIGREVFVIRPDGHVQRFPAAPAVQP